MRNIQAIALVLLSIIHKGLTVCSTEYGGEPCKFLPALPGKTPPCAKPGYTYCEYVDYYPEKLVKYLTEKWIFDHKTLLSSESPEEFTYSTPNDYSYTPNTVNENPEPIYIPKPDYPAFQPHGPLNTYIPPPLQPQQNNSGFQGYSDTRPNNPFHQEPLSTVGHNFGAQQFYNPQAQQYGLLNAYGPPPVTYYTPNEWWKRSVRETKKDQSYISKRRKRELQKTLIHTSTNSTEGRRGKRQIGPEKETLCPSFSRFIFPQAAQSVKGIWMFIVNMPDTEMRQGVKTETCISKECNGMCKLPIGFKSECETKLLQKVLIAVDPSGKQMTKQQFLFPSCCVCTVTKVRP